MKKNVIGDDENLNSREIKFESKCYHAANYNWYEMDANDLDINWQEYDNEYFYFDEQDYDPEFSIYGNGEICPTLPLMRYGLYKFTIKEINTGIEGYVYDDSEKELIVKYTWPDFADVDQQDELKFYVDGQEVDCGYEFEFTNKYISTDITTPVEEPKNEEPKNETPSGGTSSSGGGNSSGGGSSSGGHSSKGSNTSGGPGVEMKSIENNEILLANTHGQDTETLIILDQDVPLAMLPKTGDNTKDLIWIMLGISSLAILSGMYTFDKKKHN